MYTVTGNWLYMSMFSNNALLGGGVRVRVIGFG